MLKKFSELREETFRRDNGFCNQKVIRNLNLKAVENLDKSGRAWFWRRDEPLLASLFSKAKERKSKRCLVSGRCMYSGAAKRSQICDLFLR